MPKTRVKVQTVSEQNTPTFMGMTVALVGALDGGCRSTRPRPRCR